MNKLYFLLCCFSLHRLVLAQSIIVGAGLPYYAFKSDGYSYSIENKFNYNIFCKGTREIKRLRLSYGISFASRNFQYRDAAYSFKRKQNILVPFYISLGANLFNTNNHALAIDFGIAANFVIYDFQQQTDNNGKKKNTLKERDGQYFLPLSLDYSYRFHPRFRFHVLLEDAIDLSALARPRTRPLRYYVDPEAINTLQLSVKVGIGYILNYEKLPFYKAKEKK